MHLVPSDRHARRNLDASGLDEALGTAEDRIDLEQPEPLDGFLASFYAEAIDACSPHHLIAATEPEEMSALAPMRQKIDVPPLAAQEPEIADCRLGTGQDHQRGVTRQRMPGPDHHDLDPRLEFQRVEIVEIGDVRQERDRNADATSPLTLLLHGSLPLPACRERVRVRGQREGVFGWESHRRGKIRHHPETTQSGALAERADAALEQADVAAELVDNVTGEQRPFALGQQLVGADQLSDDTTALNVPDQHDRDASGFGEPHIGDIAVAQIDLGRAASSFDQHEVSGLGEPVESGEHRWQQARGQMTILAYT